MYAEYLKCKTFRVLQDYNLLGVGLCIGICAPRDVQAQLGARLSRATTAGGLTSKSVSYPPINMAMAPACQVQSLFPFCPRSVSHHKDKTAITRICAISEAVKMRCESRLHSFVAVPQS